MSFKPRGWQGVASASKGEDVSLTADSFFDMLSSQSNLVWYFENRVLVVVTIIDVFDSFDGLGEQGRVEVESKHNEQKKLIARRSTVQRTV